MIHGGAHRLCSLTARRRPRFCRGQARLACQLRVSSNIGSRLIPTADNQDSSLPAMSPNKFNIRTRPRYVYLGTRGPEGQSSPLPVMWAPPTARAAERTKFLFLAVAVTESLPGLNAHVNERPADNGLNDVGTVYGQRRFR